MSAESSKDEDVELTEIEFNSTTLYIDGFGAGVVGTGGSIWEAAYVILRHVEKWGRSATFNETDSDTSVEGLRVLDLSSGTGLVGIGCALLGATVTLTDVGDVLLGQVRENCKRNEKQISRGKGETRVLEYYWGKDTARLTAMSAATTSSTSPFHLVLASDILYCAVRDGLEKELLRTLDDLVVDPATLCVFGFKVRVPKQEKLFIDSLENDFAFDLSEIPRDKQELSDVEPSNEGIFGSMFAHDDDCDIRMFFITRRQRAAATTRGEGDDLGFGVQSALN